MRKGSRFNLEDVIGHYPDRDASLCQEYASDGTPIQAKVYRRGDDPAVTITQSPRV